MLGAEAEYVDPGSECSIQEGILRMLGKVAVDKVDCTNQTERESELETWDEVGNKLASLYCECVVPKGSLLDTNS